MKNCSCLKSISALAVAVLLSINVNAQPYPVHKYPYVSLKKNEFQVPVSGMENIKVVLTSDTTWSTDIDSDWLTRDKGVGTHNDTLYVTVYENPEDTGRAATIKISADGGPVQAHARFYQASNNPELYAPKDTIHLGDTINWTDTIQITSNTAWNVASSAKWLIVSPENGINNARVAIMAERNFTADERTAIITISAYDVDTVFIPVKQAAGDTSLAPKDEAYRIIPRADKNQYLCNNFNFRKEYINRPRVIILD